MDDAQSVTRNIKTLDDWDTSCAMPNGELENHIAQCFNRFDDFTQYSNHNQYFSHLKDEKYIQCNAVGILVISSQCNE